MPSTTTTTTPSISLPLPARARAHAHTYTLHSYTITPPSNPHPLTIHTIRNTDTFNPLKARPTTQGSRVKSICRTGAEPPKKKDFVAAAVVRGNGNEDGNGNETVVREVGGECERERRGVRGGSEAETSQRLKVQRRGQTYDAVAEAAENTRRRMVAEEERELLREVREYCRRMDEAEAKVEAWMLAMDGDGKGSPGYPEHDSGRKVMKKVRFVVEVEEILDDSASSVEDEDEDPDSLWLRRMDEFEGYLD